MVGFMNEAAWKKTVETGKVTFWSRSRNELWTKGSSSGHYLAVKEIQTDCDQDTLLIQAESLGSGVCHNGYRSCFYRRLTDGAWRESEKPTYDPKAVYQK
jgi:phosphoribosyl-AMP cyclohydrolase